MPSPTVDELAIALESDNLVTLVVKSGEPDQKEYKVQRAVLTNASPWFNKALTGDWQEANQQRITFSDTEPDVIKHFLYFLIKGDACLPKPAPDNELLAVRLWVFADKHLLPDLQNQVMKWLLDHPTKYDSGEDYPSVATIIEAVESSIPDSDLHSFMKTALIVEVQHGPVILVNDADFQIGRFTNEDLMAFERVPRMMTDLLAMVVVVLNKQENVKYPKLSEFFDTTASLKM